MKKKIIGILLLLGMAVAAYFGYAKYSHQKLIESLAPHVKNISLRLANALTYEAESTNITYKELLEKLENDIAEIDKRLLEVQTIASPENKATTDTVIDYIKTGQELLRSELNKNRKQLAVTSGFKFSQEMLLAELKSDFDSIEYKYNKKAYEKAEESLKNAKMEFAEAKTDFLSSLKKMDSLRVKLSTLMPIDKLLDSALLKKVIDPMDAEIAAKVAAAAEAGEKVAKKAEADLRRSKRFTSNGDGTVTDNETGLMWAEKDNGKDINWSEAKTYCQNYRGGERTDWKMPTQVELSGLYDAYAVRGHTHLIKMGTFQWSSETRDSEASLFLFDRGNPSWYSQSSGLNHRVLPVRGGK